ncbi:MAG TPA: GNAT family N-acetyltransferase [Gaiellaceae bacterium]|nr:GNAT family N-acetyltransferase [Gaiellaceae bacterium]
MKLVRADTLSFAELADLFTRGYEGYLVPMHVDEATMRLVVDAWDIDLARSCVALDEGAAVGVANLGARGGRGWIGGLGVVPQKRRRGIGRALMEAVLADAPPVLTLEVIEQNEPAIRLYEQLGFAPTRVLEVWAVAETPYVEARRAEPAPLGQHDLPWQREDESLPADYERLEVDGGAVLLRGPQVLQLDARDEDVALRLLSRGTPLRFVNVPEDDVASAALRRLGGELELRQLEMVRRG